MSTLTAHAPGAPPIERRLDRSPFVLGREGDVDLAFELAWLSRRHLIFEREPSGWTVRSEGRNEVRVDGRALRGKVLLEPGARIDVGPLLVIFDAGPLPLEEHAALGKATLELPLEAIARAEARRHLHRLGAVAAELALAASEREAAEAASDAALEITGARAAYVILYSQAEARADVLAARGARVRSVSRTLLAQVSTGSSAVSYASAAHMPELASQPSIQLEDVGPVLAAPIGAPAVGVLYADRRRDAAPFAEDDLVFVGVLARLLGPALLAARTRAAEASARRRAEDARDELLREIERRGQFGRLIGASPPMKKLAAAIAKVAPSDATTLVLGETGAGKELVARELHQRSARRDGPFFAINCAALPDTLLESELFGHRKGAFTGAERDRKGLFELAEGGTLFLDELGELSASAQAKLLRVLETREVLPLGGDRPVPVSVRLVAATHRDLADEVKEGRFRRDLLYRLSVFPLHIPPLRERAEDIPGLVAHFLERSAEARRKRIAGVSPDAMAAFAAHDYPGNVRELGHLVERAAILAEPGERIELDHLPEELVRTAPRPPRPSARADSAGETLRDALEAFERGLILRELERTGWNRTKAARNLDVSLRAFMRKLKQYELREDQ